MGDQRILALALQRGEAEQHRVVTERARRPRLCDRLLSASDRARDHEQRSVGPAGGGLGRELEHGLVEAGLADCELRRVDADREAAGAGIDVVAGEGALAARDRAFCRHRARVGGRE